jgi:hypothetical protein
MGGACGTYGGRIGAFGIFAVKPKVKRTLERSRDSWKDTIKKGLQEVGWGHDCIDLAKDRDRWRAFVTEGLLACKLDFRP